MKTTKQVKPPVPWKELPIRIETNSGPMAVMAKIIPNTKGAIACFVRNGSKLVRVTHVPTGLKFALVADEESAKMVAQILVRSLGKKLLSKDTKAIRETVNRDIQSIFHYAMNAVEAIAPAEII